MLALESVQARLAGPRSRLRTLVAAHDAAQSALTAAGAERWITYDIQQTTEEGFRQETRGRPGSETRYRKTTKMIFKLTFNVDEEKVAYDAATDGCFPWSATVATSPTPNCSPPTATSRTSRNATTNSRPSYKPPQ